MPISIPVSYVQSYQAEVRKLAQQEDTRLRRFVTEVSRQSEKHNWERLAQSNYRQKTAARMSSPSGGNGSGIIGSTDGLDWSRRQTLISTYDAGEIVEHEDPVQMLADPISNSSETLAMSMRRAQDDIIINAATGPAKDGNGSDVPWVGTTVGTGAANITLQDLIDVQEAFNAQDIDPSERKCLVVGPKQWSKLLGITEVVSRDFQMSQALATGMLPAVMGFDIILSNRLLEELDGTPGVGKTVCIAFTRKGIGFHVARDITAKVDQRSDMSFAWQLYVYQSIAAVRVEDEHVVALHVLD